MAHSTNVTWKQGLTLPHDPDDVGDFILDMTDVVGLADTLSSAAITAIGVTGAILSSTVEGTVNFRVSGGISGDTSYATIQITMASGRVQSRTINFNVLER